MATKSRSSSSSEDTSNCIHLFEPINPESIIPTLKLLPDRSHQEQQLQQKFTEVQQRAEKDACAANAASSELLRSRGSGKWDDLDQESYAAMVAQDPKRAWAACCTTRKAAESARESAMVCCEAVELHVQEAHETRKVLTEVIATSINRKKTIVSMGHDRADLRKRCDTAIAAVNIDSPLFDPSAESAPQPVQPRRRRAKKPRNIDDLPILKLAQSIKRSVDSIPLGKVDDEEIDAESLLNAGQFLSLYQLIRAIQGEEVVKQLRGPALRKMQLWHLPLQHAINDTVRDSLKATPGWSTAAESGIVPGDFFVSHALEELRDANIHKMDAVRLSTFLVPIIAKGYLYSAYGRDSRGNILALKVRTAKENSRTAASVGYTARVVKEKGHVFHSLDRCEGLQLIKTVGDFQLHDEAFTDVSESHYFGSNRLLSQASLRLTSSSRVELAAELLRQQPGHSFSTLKNHTDKIDDASFLKLPLKTAIPESVLARKIYSPATLPDKFNDVHQRLPEDWLWQAVDEKKEGPSDNSGRSDVTQEPLSHINTNSQHSTAHEPPRPSTPAGSRISRPPPGPRAQDPRRPHQYQNPASNSNTEPIGSNLNRAASGTFNPGGLRGDVLRSGVSSNLGLVGLRSGRGGTLSTNGPSDRVEAGRVEKSNSRPNLGRREGKR
ncbi:hypothetical protein LTR17_023529 [Elasticomyces elasticus]|nr:hypothetical protein LTR17_023529 [Elasticomyces elasticus]